MKKFSFFTWGVFLLSFMPLHYCKAQFFDPELLADLYSMSSSGSPTSNLSSGPSNFIAYNDVLYFSATDDNGTELWKYDGINEPEMVADINPGTSPSGVAYSSNPKDFVVYNGVLHFSAYTQDAGGEIWSYDGVNEPELLHDLNPGTNFFGAPNSASVSGLTVYNDKIYFSAFTGVFFENELWSYDGTDFVEIDVNVGYGSSDPANMYVHNGAMYFSAKTGANGTELWRLNGDDLEMLPEINPGIMPDFGIPLSSNPKHLTSFQGDLYFTAQEESNGIEIYKYDGVNDPELVADINSGATGSNPTWLTVYNDKLYFSADVSGVSKLMVYDGINDPEILYEINPTGNVDADYLTVYEGYMFFGAKDGVNGLELWQYNGINDPVMVEDIREGSLSSVPSHLYVFQESLFFAANDGTTGSELWKLKNEIFIGTIDNQILCNGFTFEEEIIVSDPQGAEITFMLTSDNTAVVPNENLSFSGEFPYITVEVETVAGQTGDVNITMTATTDSDEKIKSFMITVVDDCAPAFEDLPVGETFCNSYEYESMPFEVTNPNLTDLSITATSSDTDLLPNENITVAVDATGHYTLSFTLLEGTAGDVSITLTADNGETTEATIDYTIIQCAAAIEGLPTEQIVLCTDEGTIEEVTVDFTVTDPLDGTTVVEVTSSNNTILSPENITLEENEEGYHLTMSPSLGSDVVVITVIADNGVEISTETFELAIGLCAPEIANIPDVSFCDDVSPTVPVEIMVNGGEDMIITFESSNTLLLPESSITYLGSAPNYFIHLTFAEGISGTTSITVTATNEGSTDTASFDVVVEDCDLALNAPSDDTFCDGLVYNTDFTVSNGDANVSIMATSSNETIISNGNIEIVGSGENYALAASNTSGEIGMVEITITATKFDQSFTETFNLEVRDCMGLGEEAFENVSLLPNPGNGQFAITGLRANTQIEISNAMGQSIAHYKTTNDKAYINLNLVSGIYYVKLIQGNQSSIMKYVVK